MFALIHKHKRIAAVIIAIASLSFLFWMFSVSDIRQMFGLKRCVAVVNNSCITPREFNYELLRFSGVLNNQELRGIVKRQVLNSLISREVLYQKALDLGIVASDMEIAETVKKDTSFFEGNAFSINRYRDFLERVGLTPAEYEEILRKVLTVRKLYTFIEKGGYISNIELELQKKLNTVSFEGKLYLITPDIVEIEYEPAEDELKGFFMKNKDKFRVNIPAVYRVWMTPSKEEAHRIYSELKRGKIPEGGKLYQGEDTKSLPKDMVSAVEKLNYSERVMITKFQNTYYIAYLEKLPEEKVKSFEEVKEQVKKMFTESKKVEKLKSVAMEIREKLSAGKSVDIQALRFERSGLEEFLKLFRLDEDEVLRLVFSKEKVFGPYSIQGGLALVYLENKVYSDMSDEELKELRERLISSKTDSLLNLLADKLVKSASIKINEDYLR